VGPQAQHAAEGAAAAPGTHDLHTLVCTQMNYVHSYSGHCTAQPSVHNVVAINIEFCTVLYTGVLIPT
jgi:hypothetical protein